MANYTIDKIKYGNNVYEFEIPKIYTSSTAPLEGNEGDLWLKVSSDEAYAVFDSNDGNVVNGSPA